MVVNGRAVNAVSLDFCERSFECIFLFYSPGLGGTLKALPMRSIERPGVFVG
jgi:hypothetical protein